MTGGYKRAIKRQGRKRVRWIRIDGLRLRLALRVLPERFRYDSSRVWLTRMENETAQIEASTKEITELTQQLKESAQ